MLQAAGDDSIKPSLKNYPKQTITLPYKDDDVCPPELIFCYSFAGFHSYVPGVSIKKALAAPLHCW